MPIGGSRTQVAIIPYVQEEKCLVCWPCQARTACKSKALIQIDRGDPPFIDASRCFGCHTCMGVCPVDAISLRTDTER
jgi:MinD superfamily P-loop ATPase